MRLNFNLADKNKTKKDGSIPLRAIITHANHRKVICLGISIPSEYWDIDEQNCIERSIFLSNVNSYLFKLKSIFITEARIQKFDKKYDIEKISNLIKSVKLK